MRFFVRVFDDSQGGSGGARGENGYIFATFRGRMGKKYQKNRGKSAVHARFFKEFAGEKWRPAICEKWYHSPRMAGFGIPGTSATFFRHSLGTYPGTYTKSHNCH